MHLRSLMQLNPFPILFSNHNTGVFNDDFFLRFSNELLLSLSGINLSKSLTFYCFCPSNFYLYFAQRFCDFFLRMLTYVVHERFLNFQINWSMKSETVKLHSIYSRALFINWCVFMSQWFLQGILIIDSVFYKSLCHTYY